MRESIGKVIETELSPDIVRMKQEVYRLPGVEAIGGYLVQMLNEDLFRQSHFDEVLSNWNNKTAHTGQSIELEEVRCKGGKLKTYFFPESNSVKFGYEFNESNL